MDGSSELWAAAEQCATLIGGSVRPGEVVATAADTGPEAVAITAAISALGAIELPLAPDVTESWAARLLEATRATVGILATPGSASIAKGGSPRLGTIAPPFLGSWNHRPPRQLLVKNFQAKQMPR